MAELVSVRAGRFKYDAVTRKAVPSAAEGVLTVKWVEDQKHIVWSGKGNEEDSLDIIVFQDDAKFDLYKNNIFVLWFQTYEDKYFFWLQSEQSAEDVQKRVQAAINAEEPPMIEEPHSVVLENQPDKKSKAMDVEQPALSAKKVEGVKGLEEMIQKLMKKKNDQKARMEEMGLAKFLSGDTLKVIEENATEDLIKFLPEGQQDKQSLRENLYSPQIQQAIDNLEQALYSDGAGALFHEMGLDLRVLENNFGTEALLKGLMKWAKEEKK